MSTSSQPVVSMRGLVKSFPGVVALAGVDLDIHPGEILGLVGKNGAGKSTLIKLLAGVERPDSGEILVEGQRVPHHYAPHIAHRLGLAFVHQELGNFPALTVADNVALGGAIPLRARLLVRTRELARRVQSVLTDLDAELDPFLPIGELTNVQQRLVMIARGLYHNARVLFLDEPSASLTIEEINHLNNILFKLKERGHSVVYVSHRLSEIITLTDRVVVMQDGNIVLDRPTRQITETALIDTIAGHVGHRQISPVPTRQNPSVSRTVLAVRGLSRAPLVRDVSFDIQAGEILGLVGLVGSGRTEIARMIFGADRPDAGTIEVEGKRVRLRTPTEATRLGIALLPEDRRHDGLILDFSVSDNITLASLPNLCSRWLPIPRRAKERGMATDMIQRLSIRTRNAEQHVRRLSGGNQQKVVLAKWLPHGGRILIFDEPTQGIDVGTKEEIFAEIREVADKGCAVIFISSDFSECARICTRAIVLREGTIAGTLLGREVTENAMVRLAYARHDTQC